MKVTKYLEDSIPRYSDLAAYPNNRKGHCLRRLKNGLGLCECERWELEGASESSLIRSHQLHIHNMPTIL